MNLKDKKNKTAKKMKEYSFHDIRSNNHRKADYSEVRSAIKKGYKKSSKGVRELAQNLKPNTSEAIPTFGGYYSRIK